MSLKILKNLNLIGKNKFFTMPDLISKYLSKKFKSWCFSNKQILDEYRKYEKFSKSRKKN